MGTPLAVLMALAAGYFGRAHPAWGCALFCCGALALALTLRGFRIQALGTAALLLLAAAGWRGAATWVPRPLPLEIPTRFAGRVVDDPTRGVDGFRVLVDLARSGPGSGRVNLRVVGFPEPPPGRGDLVLFSAALRAPRGLQNPGSSRIEDALSRKQVDARAAVQWPGEALFAEPGPGTPRWLRWRRAEVKAMAAAVPGQAGAVLAALTLGDWSWITPETSDSFRRAGTVHLVAISGLHLGILAMLLLPPLRYALGRSPAIALRTPTEPLARALVLPALALYAGVSGLQTSTLRALVMASLLLVGQVASRPAAPLGLLAASAAVLAAPFPAVLGDPGFQLSVAALAGLFWLAPRLEARIRGAPEEPDPLAPPPRVWTVLGHRLGSAALRITCASVAASLATAPVCALNFGSSSLLGLFLNPLAVPLGEFFCLPVALAGTALHGVWPAAGEVLWRLAGLGIAALLKVQEVLVPRVPSLDWGALTTPWGLVGALALLAAIGLALERPPNLRPALWLGVSGLTALLAPEAVTRLQARGDPNVHLWVLDVGQAQALVLRLPGERWCLLDGAGYPGSAFDPGERIVLPALRALGARRLWLTVCTHPHPDHVLGLPAVVRQLGTETLWLPEPFLGDERCRSLLDSACAVGARVEWIGSRGRTVEGSGARLRALASPVGDENDRSLVVRVDAGALSALLPADLGARGQELLLAKGFPPRCALLVAPHHGSARAVNSAFLQAARPAVILVSAAGRRGLPSPQFLSAAREAGARVFCTAEVGCLHARFGPKGLAVDSWAFSR